MVAEKYQLDKALPHYSASESVSLIQPSPMARSHMAHSRHESGLLPILDGTRDWIAGKSTQSLTSGLLFPAQRQTLPATSYLGNMPFHETAEVPGSNTESSSAPLFDHLDTYPVDFDMRVSRKDSEAVSLSAYESSRSVASGSPSKGHDRIELFLATLEGTSRKDSSSPDIALAPVDRSVSGSANSEVAEGAAGSALQNEGTDMEALAREGYTIIKRRLAIERERVICV